MTMNLFDQFAAPHNMGISLSLIALLLPLLLMPVNRHPISSRLSTLQINAMTTFTKQLMTPISNIGRKWSLPLMSIMVLLVLTNLLGLLPYTFTPTTQLSLNMGLAAPLWFTTVLLGLRTQPTTSLAHMLPLGTPTPLIPMLVLIETASLLIRPIALGVRLTANLTAGHLLLALISYTTISLISLTTTGTIIMTTLLVLLTGLEMAVALIQAYVFTMLLSLYLQENT